MDEKYLELATKRLTETREASGLNQKDFAEHFGVNKTTYSRYESGDIKKMPFNFIEKIAYKYSLNPSWLLGYEDVEKHISFDKAKEKTKRLTVLGKIAAGAPLLAQEDILGYEHVPENFNADFCLKVKGDSMINARIFDGDIVYVRKQPEVETGEIAVVIIDGEEATLKRVYKGDGYVILKPENPRYSDLLIDKKEMKDITILGKAVYFRSEVR